VSRRAALITSLAVALIVAAYFLLWPSVLQAVQGMHGPLGGGPAMHFR
jgi:hypothetical protein